MKFLSFSLSKILLFTFSIIQTKKDIFSKSFIPSQEDAIYISTKTTGVIEHKTIINHVHFEIFDTGGQASERKKWPQCKLNNTKFSI